MAAKMADMKNMKSNSIPRHQACLSVVEEVVFAKNANQNMDI
jgi:hypothetical protein